MINVTGNDNLFVIVPYATKRGKFPLSCTWIVHGFRYLNILFPIGASGNEVHFLVADFSDRDIIATAQKLKIRLYTHAATVIIESFVCLDASP